MVSCNSIGADLLRCLWRSEEATARSCLFAILIGLGGNLKRPFAVSYARIAVALAYKLV